MFNDKIEELFNALGLLVCLAGGVLLTALIVVSFVAITSRIVVTAWGWL